MAEKIEFVVTAKDATARVFDEIQKNVKGIGSELAGFALGAGAAAAAIALVGIKAGEAAEELQNNARLLGVSAQTLREWGFAAEHAAGITGENLNASLIKLAQRAGEAARGNEQLLDSFNRIGISQTDLKGSLSNLDALFPAVINGLRSLGNGYSQVTVAQKLLEEQGVKLVGLVRRSPADIAAMTAAFREQAGVITDEEVAALADAKREWDSFLTLLNQRALTTFAKLSLGIKELLTDLDTLGHGAEIASVQLEIARLNAKLREGPGLIDGIGAALTAMAGGQKDGAKFFSDIRTEIEALEAKLASLRSQDAAPPVVEGAPETLNIFGFSIESLERDAAAFAANAELQKSILAELNIALGQIDLDRLAMERETTEQLIFETEARFEAAKRSADATARLEAVANKKRRLDQAQYYLSALAGASSYNKTFFEISKVAAIANATVATYQGAAQALKDVPYPYNIAAAAAVVVAGIAQIGAIASTSFGGTATPSAASGPGGFAAGPGQIAAPSVAVAAADQQQGRVELVIRGTDDFGRMVADALDVAVNQRDVVIIRPESRQAAELAT